MDAAFCDRSSSILFCIFLADGPPYLRNYPASIQLYSVFPVPYIIRRGHGICRSWLAHNTPQLWFLGNIETLQCGVSDASAIALIVARLAAGSLQSSKTGFLAHGSGHQPQLESQNDERVHYIFKVPPVVEGQAQCRL